MKNIRFILAMLFVGFSAVSLTTCGGGGGGGGTSPAPPPSGTPGERTTISGAVTPPAGVAPSSLTIVSLGETSSVSQERNFKAQIRTDGVTVVAAMPQGKEFGLMSVVATTTTSSAKGAKEQIEVVSAYKAASNSSIELNTLTTAVSMVFITPYFITNDPQRAANLLEIIENNPEVQRLATIIADVFNESDPLSNITLQLALSRAVQSVLDKMVAQVRTSIDARAPSRPKIQILQLPKSRLAEPLPVTNPPYYADHDYLTLKAIETSSGYDLSVESKSGGSVDWIAETMQLDKSQFNSLLALEAKASNNRSLYENERSRVLGQLDATSKSYFRYFDLIETAFDWAFNKVFGNTLEDRITVSSTEDAIYLVRAYSGGWGRLVDPGEKLFVRTQVLNGHVMDERSFSINLFLTVFDTMSAFCAFDSLLPDNMNKVAKAGFEEAFGKVPSVMGNPDPNMRDLIAVSADIAKAILSELIEGLLEQSSKSFFKSIYRTSKMIGESAVKLTTLDTAIKLGKPADRFLQLLVSSTPMETAIIVVGTPFAVITDTTPPSIPKNLVVTAISTSQINLSWATSIDNVGVTGYKIYWNGLHIKSVTTNSGSITGLSPSTNYCYSVSAYDSAGNESGQSSQACATTQAPPISPPSIPSGLTATTASSSQIDLSWAASIGTVTGYKVYRNGSYLKSVTSTSTSDTGLSPSTNYCYYVTAYNSAGESGQSSQACATTQAPPVSPPSTPTGLTASAASSTQINLSWTASTGTVTGYRVYKNGVELKTVSTTSTSDTGLSSSTNYCYSVKAYNSAGESAQSSQVCAMTSPRGTYSISGRVTRYGVGLENVTISLSGTSYSTSTGSDGNYLIPNVSNGSHTIIPSKAGYNFDPPSKGVTVENANVVAQNFGAIPVSIDSWTSTSTTNVPTYRRYRTAVWTGTEMIVWGGVSADNTPLNTGGRYNPVTDSWQPTSTINAPFPRENHTAVWTGNEMIIWGGGWVRTGGRYNPSTDSWKPTSTTNAPAARDYHTSVWTGNEMIIWGGGYYAPYSGTGGRYNPSTDSWKPTSTLGAPSDRIWHKAIWTGSEMIIWGGLYSLNTGGRYNPVTDSWVRITDINAPWIGYFSTAIWTGSEMIIWGGTGLGSGRYNPITDSWQSWPSISSTNAPSAFGSHTAVWTGSEMIIWGGANTSQQCVNTGGRYNPVTDSWQPTSTTNAPARSCGHTAVWTGNEMIVWGISENVNISNNGGIYIP